MPEDLGDRPGIYAVLRRAAVVPTARHDSLDGEMMGQVGRWLDGS